MLLKQQAKAALEARHDIVNGLISIVNDTMSSMPSDVDKTTRYKLYVNLVTVLTSGGSTALTI